MKDHDVSRFPEIEELDIVNRDYRSSGTFVDIGANVGNHAVYMSCVIAAPKVIVFEPNEVAIRILTANLALNDCRNVDTRFLGVALASGAGRMVGTTPYVHNLGHTFYREDAQGPVQAIDGDALIVDEPIEFIKIDVEGMEIGVLAGLKHTIERWRPAIFIEVWDDALPPFVAWCEQNRYGVVETFQRYTGITNYLVMPSPTNDDAPS